MSPAENEDENERERLRFLRSSLLVASPLQAIDRLSLRLTAGSVRPSRNRPGPAASWTTRASIAACTGCRVNGEIMPQPTVIRSVARAISAEVTVDERASIPCFRHHG
jgi:hypothetical protein